MLLDGTWSGTMNVHSWDGCAYTGKEAEGGSGGWKN